MSFAKSHVEIRVHVKKSTFHWLDLSVNTLMFWKSTIALCYCSLLRFVLEMYCCACSRCTLSCIQTIRSRSLDINVKFDTGLKFFLSPISRPHFFKCGLTINVNVNVNVNINVNICNALEFPKEQKCGYLLWSIEANMIQVCFELRSEWTDAGSRPDCSRKAVPNTRCSYRKAARCSFSSLTWNRQYV